MGQRKVYQGTNPTDPYLVKHGLERAGIRTALRGEALLGVLGEIPVGEALPSVWVDEADEVQALELVEQLLSAPRLVHPAWVCPSCGEQHEPAFDSCWSCGTERPDA